MLNIIERKVTSVPHNHSVSYKQNEKFEISQEYESLDRNRNSPEQQEEDEWATEYAIKRIVTLFQERPCICIFPDKFKRFH